MDWTVVDLKWLPIIDWFGVFIIIMIIIIMSIIMNIIMNIIKHTRQLALAAQSAAILIRCLPVTCLPFLMFTVFDRFVTEIQWLVSA